MLSWLLLSSAVMLFYAREAGMYGCVDYKPLVRLVIWTGAASGVMVCLVGCNHDRLSQDSSPPRSNAHIVSNIDSTSAGLTGQVSLPSGNKREPCL